MRYFFDDFQVYNEVKDGFTGEFVLIHDFSNTEKYDSAIIVDKEILDSFSPLGLKIVRFNSNNPLENPGEYKVITTNNKKNQYLPAINVSKICTYSPPSEKEKTEKKIRDLQAFFKETDWLVIREMDQGNPVPEEIKTKRAEARTAISSLREKLKIQEEQ